MIMISFYDNGHDGHDDHDGYDGILIPTIYIYNSTSNVGCF
jgi:hypothetical protein